MPAKYDPVAAKVYRRTHYLKHKAEYLARNTAKRHELREYVRELKEKTPCKDCNVLYPAFVMDFDHRDPSTKFDIIPRVVASYGFKKLHAEIAKCDIVCANCHRIRTWRQIESKKRAKSTRPRSSVGQNECLLIPGSPST